MNRLIVFIALLGITLSVSAQNGPKIEFKDTVQYDMGTFKAGEVAEHTFVFTNTGNTALKIKEVRTTCSCTASDWPKESIMPGQTSSIKVTFDTHGKLGEYAKGVNIFSNAGETNLIIMVKVTKGDKPTPNLTSPPKTGHEGHNHD